MSVSNTYLDPPTLAALMTLDESAMRSTCDIHRTVPGPANPDNSPSDGVPSVQTGIKCRFTTLRRSPQLEELYAGRFTEESDAFIRVPIGTDVAQADTITLDGHQYEIVGVNTDRTFNTSIKLSVRLIS
jgi:hypothetical protein